jgi:hypothetical protein
MCWGDGCLRKGVKTSNLVVDLNLRRDVDAHNSTKVNLLVPVGSAADL